MLALFFSTLILGILVVNFHAMKNIPWFLPVKFFIIFNGIMSLGTIFLLDYDIEADQNHLLIIVTSTLVYALTSIIAFKHFNLIKFWNIYCNSKDTLNHNKDFIFSLGLYIICLIAVYLYFSLVGYNVIIISLTGSLSADEIKDMRLSSYAGDSYYAPGYFNQFKNILFPIAHLALSYHLKRFIKSRSLWIILVVTTMIPVILGLMGTGQRAFLVGFLIFSFIFISMIAKGAAFIGKKTIFLSVVSFIFLFSILSNLLGRSEDFTLAASLQALTERIFHDNQMSSVIGFRYVYEQPIQLGGEWWVDILGILPGENYRGSDLPNRIHAILYGSYRGTSPVSLWGSVYHNWGWLGIILFPALLSFLYASISRKFLTLRSTSALEKASYAFIFFAFSSWVASGPMQLINNGIISAIILIGCINIIRRLNTSKF